MQAAASQNGLALEYASPRSPGIISIRAIFFGTSGKKVFNSVVVSDAWNIFAPSNWGRWIQFFPIIFFRWVETQPPTSQTGSPSFDPYEFMAPHCPHYPLLLPEVAREDWNCPSCLGTEPWCNPTCDAQCEADTVGWMSVEFRKWLHHINGIKSYSVYSYMHVIKTYTDNLIVIIYIYLYIYIYQLIVSTTLFLLVLTCWHLL